MTGIADLYLYLKRPYSRDRRKRLLAHWYDDGGQGGRGGGKSGMTRFVVLSWKRTGSNLLCGILHRHPEICMHNELFNPIDIFTYHPKELLSPEEPPIPSPPPSDGGNGNNAAETPPSPPAAPAWSVLTRDLFPDRFLEYVWDNGTVRRIKSKAKAVGFKSFPEHWLDVRNESIWKELILDDLRIKKIVLHREDELAVYVSMQRADLTGLYMTHNYPKDLKIHVDPAAFQIFINNYRHTFQKKYKSPIFQRDTFWITYEQLIDDEVFERQVYPKLMEFLKVDSTVPIQRLRETIKQAHPNEDLANVIANYEELEFCFRYSDVSHFATKQKRKEEEEQKTQLPPNNKSQTKQVENNSGGPSAVPTSTHSTWSILLPICSRSKESQSKPVHDTNNRSVDDDASERFNSNRFLHLTMSSQYDTTSTATTATSTTSLTTTSSSEDSSDELVEGNEECCWNMLQKFCTSLSETTTSEQREKLTEVIVGIDIDDPVFSPEKARARIEAMIPCQKVVFVNIQPNMYGHVCKIWNHLAKKAANDYIVLLGDDIELLDHGWQDRIASAFAKVSKEQNLPHGAACVAMSDVSFPGFPTFPVIHRWHMQTFGTLLPRQFVNQGGDPYLYDLYSRYNAAAFCTDCRLTNSIGGDGDARYKKHQINWRGQILNMNLRKLTSTVGRSPDGIVLDVVVPSYRTKNNEYLRRIALLRASCPMFVKFWFVVDNPLEDHVADVKELANRLNEIQLCKDANYFVNVIHYAENRGASYARNTGYNYTTADWVLFLDDDVIPDEHILDAYAGAIRRYPDAKVFVGMTELPASCGTWTRMLQACNVGYFYGISKQMTHPSWGVTANLMVCGSRYNPTIQFKDKYPKTGGGEDIDFVYQFKEWYNTLGRRVTVGVPEAKVTHPWWNGGRQCYKQIVGWAWGDSICITEWKEKSFLACPNWIEHMALLLPPLSIGTGKFLECALAGLLVAVTEHVIKTIRYYPSATEVTGGKNIVQDLWVALGAGSVLSAQEATRVVALVRRCSLYSICRRVDWFDGQESKIKLDIQLGSIVRFGLNIGLTWAALYWRPRRR